MINDILETLYNGISAVINWFVLTIGNILPFSEGFPSNIYNSIGSILNVGKQLSFIIPFDTIFDILLLVITIEVWIFLFKFFKWIVKTIRG